MSPVEVAQKYIELNKGTGKTSALINSLPDEKCAILVSNTAAGDHIRESITRLRPEYNIDNVMILYYNRLSGWRNAVQSKDIPVYIDHPVLEAMSVDHVKAINTTYGRI